MITESTDFAPKLKRCNPSDMNRVKILQNYSLSILWTSSSLLQTTFIISSDIYGHILRYLMIPILIYDGDAKISGIILLNGLLGFILLQL